ncbi:hypothetical protein RSAG8_08905, partial [Rhizoctonia solani AG-8 WAC10335]
TIIVAGIPILPALSLIIRKAIATDQHGKATVCGARGTSQQWRGGLHTGILPERPNGTVFTVNLNDVVSKLEVAYSQEKGYYKAQGTLHEIPEYGNLQLNDCASCVRSDIHKISRLIV